MTLHWFHCPLTSNRPIDGHSIVWCNTVLFPSPPPKRATWLPSVRRRLGGEGARGSEANWVRGEDHKERTCFKRAYPQEVYFFAICYYRPSWVNKVSAEKINRWPLSEIHIIPHLLIINFIMTCMIAVIFLRFNIVYSDVCLTSSFNKFRIFRCLVINSFYKWKMSVKDDWYYSHTIKQ